MYFTVDGVKQHEHFVDVELLFTNRRKAVHYLQLYRSSSGCLLQVCIHMAMYASETLIYCQNGQSVYYINYS